MSNYFHEFNRFLRINFFGRPYELNRLVFDNDIILENKDEANKIIRAYRLFKGWQYLGNGITFVAIYASYKLSKTYKLKKGGQILLIGTSFLPLLIAHTNSYFIYWNIIREVVLKTRDRNKKYLHLKGGEIEEFKIVFNTSKDLHKYIQLNLGITSCLIEIFRH